ncbi:MAG TPA: SdrD B-like domain-containing protein [Pirellulales bacterium]|nr:SdrD B-like domain-containing protein [Pirellulales bacterium]
MTVDTNYGNFQIELLPSAAPQSVANFLSYIESGAFTDTIFHRSVPNFIVQTGGFTSSTTTYTSTSQFTTIPTNAPIPLEYNLPNIAGTVAMARTSVANSATDEWFINTVDNTNTLGASNSGGYAVFGKIIGNGMQVVNAIAAVPTTAADSSTFQSLPVGSNNQLVRISSVTLDSIDGTVFSDVNGNGQMDSGEQGVAGRTVYIDQGGTGSLTASDPQTTTDANGNYTFAGLAAGTYTVREVLPSGVTLTTGTQTITVTSGQTTSGTNFGEQPSISGTVFVDLNGNGAMDSGEPGLVGATVFLNVDNSGSPTNNPHTTSSSTGTFSFNGQAAGTYTVMVQLPSGVTLTTGTQTATVGSGSGASGLVFGELPSIDGLVFIDANKNGQADSGEQAIAGRTVYIDQSGTGSLTASDPQTTTNAQGLYYFMGIAAGNYTVKEVAPAGTQITTPAQNITVTAGQVTSAINFGEVPPSISGTVFVDMNTNGTFDAGDIGLAGRTVFLNNDGTGAPDANNPSTTTDSLGKYYFTGLAAGTYKVREVVAAGVTLTTTNQDVTVTANQTTTGVNLGEGPSIEGTVFTDLNGNGTLDSGEAGVAGRTVFLNVDNTGVPDASNPSTTTDASGNFVFSGLAAGTYQVMEVLSTNVTLTTATTQTAAVTNGNTVQNIDFGELPAITGSVFIDENGNAQFDSSEPGVPGQTVFLNVDNTGSPANNPKTVTDSNGNYSFTGIAPGTYTVMEVLPTGVTLTTGTQTIAVSAAHTTSGVNFGDRPSITGTVFTDSNGNGQLDSGEQGVSGRTVYIDSNNNGKLDSGEPTTVTSSNGTYAFLAMAAGTYTVREVIPSGTVLSTPPLETVTVTAGQATSNVNFGEAVDTTTPNITGTVFADNNLNGKLDSGEPGLAGRTVFIDKDGSGVPGPNNPSTTTDANGNFSFIGLPAGTYTVKEVVSANHGVTITTPVQTVTVTVGQTQAGVDFGNLVTSTLSPLPYSPNNAASSSSSSDPNGAYINSVYESVLGRAADSASLAYWKGQMANGATRADVARGVWNSTEHRTNELDQYYQTFLGRSPDAAGKAFWLNDFSNSATEEAVVSGFVTSQEYTGNLHPTDSDFIGALYNDIVERPADSAGLAMWTGLLQNGESRLQVATAFINGQESSAQLVDGFFAAFLHRAIDASGRQTWLNMLTNNPSSLSTGAIENAAIQILASDEFFTHIA